MEELIHFTNFTSYYGHIHLMSLHFDAFNAEINLIIDINLDDLNYTWEIKAEQVLDFKNLTQCSLNPFFVLRILIFGHNFHLIFCMRMYVLIFPFFYPNQLLILSEEQYLILLLEDIKRISML